MSDSYANLSVENTLLAKQTLEHPRQRIAFTTASENTVLVSLQLALGFGSAFTSTKPQGPDYPTDKDPFGDWMPPPPKLPIPEAQYYIYDHLGNTRLTYTVDLPYNGGSAIPGIPISYHLETVNDYFPYGKVLRTYYGSDNFPERYATTYHVELLVVKSRSMREAGCGEWVRLPGGEVL